MGLWLLSPTMVDIGINKMVGLCSDIKHTKMNKVEFLINLIGTEFLK